MLQIRGYDLSGSQWEAETTMEWVFSSFYEKCDDRGKKLI